MKYRRVLKDRLARYYMLGIAVLSLLLILIIGLSLLFKALPIMKEHSLGSLLSSSSWKPFKGEFGFLPFILSTLYVSLIAIILALPAAMLTSIYLNSYASDRLRRFFEPVIDLLSGIPPVIYGVWGTLTVVPLISEKIAPHFVEFSAGYSVLAGGLVLAIMILPLLISILLEVFRSMPEEISDASLSLGATKWQTVKKVMLRRSIPGIIAAIVLAISRAFGETIAVLMVCGNIPIVPKSIFEACYPLPALIANNYGEMLSMPGYESALMLGALLLFLIIVLFNGVSRITLNRIERRFQL
ncbi:MAG TPA: phosphate ABC transporter permease subunit PstC [Bacteroidales bacterium]|nr:phosphate ABC transporter permease subunit PstC [Bacteroidales bacterium]